MLPSPPLALLKSRTIGQTCRAHEWICIFRQVIKVSSPQQGWIGSLVLLPFIFFPFMIEEKNGGGGGGGGGDRCCCVCVGGEAVFVWKEG